MSPDMRPHQSESEQKKKKAMQLSFHSLQNKAEPKLNNN